tara:strand:- start:1299 stop:1514 length:216 start_codon:yes stop_codon:yes gene_type:complete
MVAWILSFVLLVIVLYIIKDSVVFLLGGSGTGLFIVGTYWLIGDFVTWLIVINTIFLLGFIWLHKNYRKTN